MHGVASVAVQRARCRTRESRVIGPGANEIAFSYLSAKRKRSAGKEAVRTVMICFFTARELAMCLLVVEERVTTSLQHWKASKDGINSGEVNLQKYSSAGGLLVILMLHMACQHGLWSDARVWMWM